MTATARFAPDPRRRAMIGKVKIAQKELGLDDATYRAVLQRIAGRSSAADCSEAELGRVLDEFKAKGWKPAAPGADRKSRAGVAPAPKAADHAMAGKARALWISLHQLGVVRDASERALESFAARQLGVDRLQWADQAQGFRLIEALKAMAERAGWDQDVSQAAIGSLAKPVHELKRRLVQAQWARLSELGAIRGGGAPHFSGLSQWGNGAATTCSKSVASWTEAELDRAAPKLGRWIAQVQAARAPSA